MKTKATAFSATELKSLALILAESTSHRDLNGLLAEAGLTEQSSGGPRWQRIYNALAHKQIQTGTGNYGMKLISVFLNPRKFIKQQDRHAELLEEVNQLLAFRGLQFTEQAEFRRVKEARSIKEACARADELRHLLQERNVHKDVLVCCRPELVDGNYFHAVLEASKSVSKKLTSISRIEGDGAEIARKTLSLGKSGTPIIALNSLGTPSEKSEQTGFMNLLIGLFGLFRNPTAHELREEWPITQEDALDMLTMVSYIHRRLDKTKN